MRSYFGCMYRRSEYQFSLEEEDFYKDIQDLVKNGSQNEKELSSFLQRYMDLLARADLDEETFIINFTKAGLIIEASAKVYGSKVDRLWKNLEHVLESLKNKGHGCKKKSDCEDDAGDDLDVDGNGCDEEGKRKLPSAGRKKKKLGDALFSSDDFLEIDNITGLLGKNMNESNNKTQRELKLCEKVPNMFIKNKTKKRKMDVCLNKLLEDKDVIRLRDWVISTECHLVKEIYTSLLENVYNSNALEGNELGVMYYDPETYKDDDGNMLFEEMEVDSVHGSIAMTKNLKDEKNNNINLGVDLEESLRETVVCEKLVSEEKDNLMEELNISRESDVAKFPNVLDRLSGDCLVDVDEVFWNSSKFQDVIPSKKMRAGKTNKLPCQLCVAKKDHKKKGKRCVEEKKLDCLDSYFTPHVQPTISEPQFVILPDEDLYSIFKAEMKLIEQLGKMNACRNINKAYHPDEKPEELRNFLGFDGFESCLMKRTIELQEHEMSEENVVLEVIDDDDDDDDNENYPEEPPPDNEFELPFPATQNNTKSNNDPESNVDELLANSVTEYQKLVMEELKDHYAAKSSFAENKELGIKISKWHEMIADKIKLSQERGALNMNSLAYKIMSAFPSSGDGLKSVMTFRDLVRKQSRRDVPRYFFACLQLTNEGNLDIRKSDSQSLATDCMIITRLRATRTNYELDECTSKSPSKVMNSAVSLTPLKRKRNSVSPDSSILESKNLTKKKKLKQKILKCSKRPKNFNTVTDSKRRRCSVSSADSVVSE